MANETQAQIGYGTLLQLGNDASPQVFTTIAEVKSINGFGFSADELEATHMLSPGGYKEFVAGMKMGDTATIVMNCIRENVIQTKVVWDAGLVRDFQLNLPSTLPDYDFSMVPLAWHLLNVQPNGILEVEVQGRITGAITGS